MLSLLGMRVEPYEVGSFIHVVKRGARGMSITGDESDRRRFMRLLFLMNDGSVNPNWAREVDESVALETIERTPLVKIIAATLMSNHFHLILQEIRVGGVSSFMQKLGQSMTNHFNEKYKQRGSLFQGAYRSRTISDDEYFRYVVAYVLVKNVFELYPHGGLKKATTSFKSAWEWAAQYPYSSLKAFVHGESAFIFDMEQMRESFGTVAQFKSFARDVIDGGKWLEHDFE